MFLLGFSSLWAGVLDGIFGLGPGTLLSVSPSGDNDTVFVDAGGGVIVYERSPTSFEQRSTIHLPREVTALHYDSPFLFVGLREGGVRIYDLSDLSNPVIKGAIDLPGRITEMCVYAGSYLFVAAERGGIVRVNFSNPSNPVLDAQRAFDGAVQGLTIHNDYLLAAAEESGLLIFDLTDTSLTPITLSQEAPVLDLAVFPGTSDDYVYVLLANQTIKIYPFSSLLSTPSPSASIHLDRSFKHLLVDGSYLILTDNSLIYTYSLEDPSDPVFRKSFSFTDFRCRSNYYCYGLQENTLHLLEYDSFEELEEISLYGSLKDAALANGKVVAAYGQGGIRILDFSSSAPSEIGGFTNATALSSVDAVAFNGTLAFLGGPEGLVLLDLSDPSNPVQRLTHSLPSAAKKLSFNGTYLYVLTSEGINIYSLDTSSDPPSLNTVGNISAGGIKDFLVNGTTVFVAQGPVGVSVWDLSGASPVRRSWIGFSGRVATGLTLYSNFLYVSVADDSGAGLQVVNVSDLDFPVIGEYVPLGIHTAFSGQVLGTNLYIPGDATGILSLSDPSSPVWQDAFGRGKVLKILKDDTGKGILVFRSLGFHRFDPAGSSASDFTEALSREVCEGSGYQWCSGICRQGGCFPDSLRIESFYNGTTPLELLNGTASAYTVIYDCLDGDRPVFGDWYLGGILMGGPHPSLKLVYGSPFQVFLGDSRSGTWEEVYPFSSDLEDRIYCVFQEGSLEMRVAGPTVQVEATPDSSGGGLITSGPGGGSVSPPGSGGGVLSPLGDLASATEDIISGEITPETVEEFGDSLGGAASALEEDIAEDSMGAEEARDYLDLLPEVLEASRMILDTGEELPVVPLEDFLSQVDEVSSQVRDTFSPEGLDWAWVRINEAVDHAGELVERFSGSDTLRFYDELGNLAASLVKVSDQPEEAVEAIHTGFSLVKGVVLRAMEDPSSGSAVRGAVETLPSWRSLVEEALLQAGALGAREVRVALDSEMTRGLYSIAHGLRERILPEAVDLADVQAATGVLREIAAPFLNLGNGFSLEVTRGLSFFSDTLLDGVRDELSLEGARSRPYLLNHVFEVLGVDFTDELNLREPVAEGFDPVVDVSRNLLHINGALDVKGVLRKGLESLRIAGQVEAGGPQNLIYTSGSTRLSFQIEGVRLLPERFMDVAAALPDGRALVSRGPLYFRVAPSPANPVALSETFAEVLGPGAFRFRSNGVLEFDLGTVSLRATPGYLIEHFPAGFAQGLVTFTVVGGDPASETYRVLAVYPDQTTQALAPFPAAAESLFGLLEYLFPEGWHFDRETGVLEITGVARFKTDYEVVSLTEEERNWFEQNQDPRFSLAFRVEDVNEDGLLDVWVYSDEGKQLFWGL